MRRPPMALAAAAFVTLAMAAQEPRSVWDGVFTEAQSDPGKALYARECASCHGDSLGGGESAPPLVGEGFLAKRNGLTVGDQYGRPRVDAAGEPWTADVHAGCRYRVLYTGVQSVSARQDRSRNARRSIEADGDPASVSRNYRRTIWFCYAAIHFDESFQGDLFGAQSRFRPRLHYLSPIGLRQVVAEGLALLAERQAYEPQEIVGRLDPGGGRPRLQQYDRGNYLGRRMEGSRFHFEQQPRGGKEGDFDGEKSVVAASGRGYEALGHFLLDQEHGSRRPEPGGLSQNGRSDIVRQIAGDRDAPPLGQVGSEHVGLDDLQAWFTCESAAEVAGQVGIQFDRDDAGCTFEQAGGEGAPAGANLDDGAPRIRARRHRDAL